VRAPLSCIDNEGRTCLRGSLPDVTRRLRDVAQERISITDLGRLCKLDSRIEPPANRQHRRYCFPADANLDAGNCCGVQESFRSHVFGLWQTPRSRSSASDNDRWLFLPAKIFFIVIVLVIAVFMVVWRRELDDHYRQYIPAIERGILVGAVAILFWPLMDYAHQQTSDVLFGKTTAGLPFRQSLVIVPWAILLLLYFANRLGRSLTRVTQVATIIASAVAVLRVQEIHDWSPRLLGTGSGLWTAGFLAGLALFGIGYLVWAGTRPAHDPSLPSDHGLPLGTEPFRLSSPPATRAAEPRNMT
jgi:hypothetical protein